MSNPLKGIGKIFKSVVKAVKKVALPALAIGAVVLTGGAALGVLPSVGSLAGSLGLSAGLTSTLTTAATSATIGAGMAAVTGGNVLKGATAGFVTGGVLGGVNAAMSGLGTAAKTAQAGASGLGNAASINDAALASMRSGASAAGTAASAGAQGLGSQVASSGLGLGSFSNAAQGIVQSAPAVASAAAPASSGAGGILGFINKNPIVSGMAIQGLGQGLMAMEQNKAAQREADRIAQNYSDTSGLPQYQSQGNGYTRAADVFNAAIFAGKKIEYDPKTGLKVSNG